MFQFRRGTYPARIYSLVFSLDSQLLGVSSDSDTVHIYKLVGNTYGGDTSSSPVVPVIHRTMIDQL